MAAFTAATILISTVNEDVSLKRTVRTVTETCDPADLAEIFLLVGVRATPACLAAVEELRSECAVPVVVFRQTAPGLGAGFNEIFDRMRGSHVVFLSGDGELDPAQVQTFISFAKQMPDTVIVGSRHLAKDGLQGYAVGKRVLNSAARVFLQVLFRTRRTELTQPFQIGNVEIYRAIRWEETQHPVCIEAMLKPLRLGVRAAEIPTCWHGRSEGKPNRSNLYFLRYFKTAMHIRFMPTADITKPGRAVPQSCIGPYRGVLQKSFHRGARK